MEVKVIEGRLYVPAAEFTKYLGITFSDMATVLTELYNHCSTKFMRTVRCWRQEGKGTGIVSYYYYLTKDGCILLWMIFNRSNIQIPDDIEKWFKEAEEKHKDELVDEDLCVRIPEGVREIRFVKPEEGDRYGD